MSHVGAQFLLRKAHEIRNFRRAGECGDLRKYNRKNAEFMTSLKFTYLENLYIYSS